MSKEMFVKQSEMPALCDKIRVLLSDEKSMILSSAFSTCIHLLKMVNDPLLRRRFLKLEKEFIETQYGQYKAKEKSKERQSQKGAN